MTRKKKLICRCGAEYTIAKLSIPVVNAVEVSIDIKYGSVPCWLAMRGR